MAIISPRYFLIFLSSFTGGVHGFSSRLQYRPGYGVNRLQDDEFQPQPPKAFLATLAPTTNVGVFGLSSIQLYSSPPKTGEGESSPAPLVVEGKNLEVTEALYNYVDKRIRPTLEKLSKSGNVRECDVILSVSKNPKVKNKHRAEVVTNLKGTTIICAIESPDMYSSIDSAAHALNRKLCKYKERRQQGHHGGAAMGDDLQAALEALEEQMDAEATDMEEEYYDDFVDPEAPVVTKINSFKLDKPISIDEAIFALDYVDHDFYVFTNEETNRVNVVYKRHGGGVGLIES